MSEWTLEKELLECAGVADVQAALLALGLVPENGGRAILSVDKSWDRSGAETYLLKFSVTAQGGSRTSFAMKAYAPTGIGRSLEEQFKEITERRLALAGEGVPTPHLYFAGRGLWIEEWLDIALVDQMADAIARGEDLRHWANELVGIVTVITRLGFRVENVFSDMRVRAGHVVMLDFGADLGGMGLGGSGNHNVEKLLGWATHRLPALAVELRLVTSQQRH